MLCADNWGIEVIPNPDETCISSASDVARHLSTAEVDSSKLMPFVACQSADST